jgi:hypothetical protein
MRCHRKTGRPDFLFPQTRDAPAEQGWTPAFSDYLYTSFTDAATFGPADAVPLTTLAKGLMALESLIALTTLLLVVSRAVNILG